MLTFISIPSGAIKRLRRASLVILYHYISIPSGAIKSSAGQDEDATFTNFNSFWCD